MKKNSVPESRTVTTETQGKLLLVLMVIIGYLITFFVNSGEHGVRFTFWELFWGIGFGIVFLILGFNQTLIFQQLPAGYGEGLFFTAGCALVLGIGWILGPGGNWMVGLPLIGTAVEILPSRRQWLMYTALVIAGILPVARYGSWTGVLNNSFIIAAAIAFVVVFTQSRLNEQQARKKTERLMAELENAHTRLAAYATQVEELATTQERNRLAREIHDSLGHYLTIINVQIEAAKTIMKSDPNLSMEAMNKAQELAQKGLARVRESVKALRESPVSNRSLDEVITSLVKEMRTTGIVTEFKVLGESQPLEKKVALALYRAAQEGLTNVRKHAHASRVDVVLDFSQPGEVGLQIQDNGVGTTDGYTTDGFGLVGVRERLQLLNGKLDISTGMGKGFRLKVSVPITHYAGPSKEREEQAE